MRRCRTIAIRRVPWIPPSIRASRARPAPSARSGTASQNPRPEHDDRTVEERECRRLTRGLRLRWPPSRAGWGSVPLAPAGPRTAAPHPAARHTATSARVRRKGRMQMILLIPRKDSVSIDRPHELRVGPASPRRRRMLLRTVGQLHLRPVDLLVGNQLQQVRNDVCDALRFLSSDLTIPRRDARVGCLEHGVARKRDRTTLAREGSPWGLSFHCRSGSAMRALNRFSCSLLPTSSQTLMRRMPASTIYFEHWAQLEKPFVLLLGDEPHHMLHTRLLVPRCGRRSRSRPAAEVRHVTLQGIWDFSRVRGRRKRHEAEHAWADALGDRLDRAPLPAASRPSKITITRSPLPSPIPAGGTACPAA